MLAVTLATGSTHGVAQEQSPPAQSEPVKLEPFQVEEHSLLIGWHAKIRSSKKTGLISGITFDRIEPGSIAEKAGLKAGDHLIAIDDHAIIGLKIPDYLKLLRRDVKKGETGTYLFTIERGLFRKRSVVKLSITW